MNHEEKSPIRSSDTPWQTHGRRRWFHLCGSRGRNRNSCFATNPGQKSRSRQIPRTRDALTAPRSPSLSRRGLLRTGSSAAAANCRPEIRNRSGHTRRPRPSCRRSHKEALPRFVGCPRLRPNRRQAAVTVSSASNKAMSGVLAECRSASSTARKCRSAANRRKAGKTPTTPGASPERELIPAMAEAGRGGLRFGCGHSYCHAADEQSVRNPSFVRPRAARRSVLAPDSAAPHQCVQSRLIFHEHPHHKGSSAVLQNARRRPDREKSASLGSILSSQSACKSCNCVLMPQMSTS